MATFKFDHDIDIHWNGYDIVGPAETVFSIPDQLYEEFESDLRSVEPSLTWLDTNEFLTLSNSVSAATLSATFPIALTTSTTGKTISFSSSTNPNGYLLAADGSGGVIFTPASTSGLTSVVGVSPISTTISGGTVSVSIDTASLGVGNAEVLRTYVKNSSGSTITKGQAVYVSGADGTNALIDIASASNELTSSKTLGIVASTLTNNAFGYVVENGQLSNIDTSGATAGASVWLGDTPGSLVFGAPPAEPSNSVYLGVVTKANASTGEILVKVQNGYELDELHDVYVGGVSTALPLVYSSTSSGWVAQELTSVGIADGSITSAKISAGAVDSAALASNAVVASKIAAAAVGSAALATGAVTSIAISSSAVTSGHIAAGAVGSAAIASGSINSTHIGANAVVAGDIAANAVTSGNIAAAAVGSAALADNAVVAAKINAGAVNTAKIDSGLAALNTVLTANGTGGASFLTIGSISVSTFTASGTWTKPSGFKAGYVLLVGGGGGGASGARSTASGTLRNGGGSGSGASVVQLWLDGSTMTSTSSITVTIGAGGSGAATSTTGSATAGSDGSDGSQSILQSFATAEGGLGGKGMAAAGTGAGTISKKSGHLLELSASISNSADSVAITGFNLASGAGITSRSGFGPDAYDSNYNCSGGGGGGWAVNNAGVAGGKGARGLGYKRDAAAAAGTAGSGAAAGAGGNGGTLGIGNSGGGGGSGNQNGGNGGNGSMGGGGGGGGSAVAASGTFSTGAGGNGGDGFCMIISF